MHWWLSRRPEGVGSKSDNSSLMRLPRIQYIISHTKYARRMVGFLNVVRENLL